MILMLVTEVYAYLTYRSVRLQEDPPGIRVQAEQEAVSRLEMLLATDGRLNAVRSLFPLQLGERTIEPGLRKPLQELAAFTDRLNEASLDLPVRLRLLSHAMTLELQVLRGALLRLLNTTLQERLAAEDEDRPFNWERVRLAFERASQEAGEGELGEWTNLLTGRSMEVIAQNLQNLRNAVIDHRSERWQRR